MSNIYKNVIELIGKTPLVEVENVEKRFKLQARLLVKQMDITQQEAQKTVSHIR